MTPIILIAREFLEGIILAASIYSSIVSGNKQC